MMRHFFSGGCSKCIRWTQGCPVNFILVGIVSDGRIDLHLNFRKVSCGECSRIACFIIQMCNMIVRLNVLHINFCDHLFCLSANEVAEIRE